MLWTLTLVYVASAIVTTAIVLVASRAITEQGRPGTHRLVLALLAGLAWPILLLGLFELTVIAYVKVYAEEHGEAVKA